MSLEAQSCAQLREKKIVSCKARERLDGRGWCEPGRNPPLCEATRRSKGCRAADLAPCPCAWPWERQSTTIVVCCARTSEWRAGEVEMETKDTKVAGRGCVCLGVARWWAQCKVVGCSSRDRPGPTFYALGLAASQGAGGKWVTLGRGSGCRVCCPL